MINNDQWFVAKNQLIDSYTIQKGRSRSPELILNIFTRSSPEYEEILSSFFLANKFGLK